MEGFESFGLGLLRESLMQLAIAGPIVVFNATNSGAHAFLVTQNEITSLSLPLLDYNVLKTKSQQFRVALRASRTLGLFRKSQSQLHEVLRWLWDVAVEPVLNELGFISTPNAEPWPHVCRRISKPAPDSCSRISFKCSTTNNVGTRNLIV